MISLVGTSPTARHRRPTSPQRITRVVFKTHWRTAWCISYYESRHSLAARNGANLGPWQVNMQAHPWVNGWKVTHSWWYAAKVAYRISSGGRRWSPWTTHALCGV